MSKIVIFGSSGFLGSNLFRRFCTTSKTYGIYGMSSGFLKVETKWGKTENIMSFNPSNLEKLIEEINPSVVINCSGLVGDSVCERFPDMARKANIETPGHLAELSKIFSFYLLHYSTDAVFNDDQLDRYEYTEPKPMTLYGSSKREGESLCLEKGGKVLVARTNFIGGDLSKHKNRGLFNHFATNLSQGLKVQGYAKVYFNPITIEALTKITQEVIVRNITGTLHIAGREKISKYEFAINIARYLGVKPNLVDKADYDPNSTKVFRRIMNLDVKRMLALGFEPGSLEEGIQELCRKFLMVRQAL